MSNLIPNLYCPNCQKLCSIHTYSFGCDYICPGCSIEINNISYDLRFVSTVYHVLPPQSNYFMFKTFPYQFPLTMICEYSYSTFFQEPHSGFFIKINPQPSYQEALKTFIKYFNKLSSLKTLL